MVCLIKASHLQDLMIGNVMILWLQVFVSLQVWYLHQRIVSAAPMAYPYRLADFYVFDGNDLSAWLHPCMHDTCPLSSRVLAHFCYSLTQCLLGCLRFPHTGVDM